MRRAFLLIAALFIAGVLAWEFIPIQVTIWDGGYVLTVHVSNLNGPLRSVRCEAFARHEQTEDVLKYLLLSETRTRSAVADPFVGEPLKVYVWVSGRDSPSGRKLCRTQARYLVVIGQWQDGRRAGKLVEIPDGRVSREVSVELR